MARSHGSTCLRKSTCGFSLQLYRCMRGCDVGARKSGKVSPVVASPTMDIPCLYGAKAPPVTCKAHPKPLALVHMGAFLALLLPRVRPMVAKPDRSMAAAYLARCFFQTWGSRRCVQLCLYRIIRVILRCLRAAITRRRAANHPLTLSH